MKSNLPTVLVYISITGLTVFFLGLSINAGIGFFVITSTIAGMAWLGGWQQGKESKHEN